MRTAAMSPDDYRRASQLRLATRPEPANVVDGRFWGDDQFAGMIIPTSASTADQAAKSSALQFCVSLISETVGNCSFGLFEDGNQVFDHPLADVLSNGPNPMQTAAEFWPSMLYRAALGGHAFAEPELAGDGELMLWPLHPDRIAVEWRERGFTLTYTNPAGIQRMFNAGQLFWFAGLADARLQPLTPWKLAKGSIDFALALENQGRSFFQSGKRLPGVVESDGKIDGDNFDRLSAQINQWRTGKIPLLEDGLKFKQLSGSNTDAQFAELIDQRTAEICRYWRIPRSFWATDSGNAKSDEQESRSYHKYTARPWARRIEQAIGQRLLTPDERQRLKVKINLDSLLRGDSTTQYRNAVLARTAGTHSINEIRTKWFDEPRIDQEWADDPRTPLNSNRAADTLSGGDTAPQDKVN